MEWRTVLQNRNLEALQGALQEQLAKARPVAAAATSRLQGSLVAREQLNSIIRLLVQRSWEEQTRAAEELSSS